MRYYISDLHFYHEQLNHVMDCRGFRDEQDMNRPIAPLKQADDAVLLDSTELNFAQTVEKVKEIIKERV